MRSPRSRHAEIQNLGVACECGIDQLPLAVADYVDAVLAGGRCSEAYHHVKNAGLALHHWDMLGSQKISVMQVVDRTQRQTPFFPNRFFHRLSQSSFPQR